jgi:hypothetical protein
MTISNDQHVLPPSPRSPLVSCPINKFAIFENALALNPSASPFVIPARVAAAREESRIGLDVGSSTAGQRLQLCWFFLRCAARSSWRRANRSSRASESCQGKSGIPRAPDTRGNDKRAAPHVKVLLDTILGSYSGLQFSCTNLSDPLPSQPEPARFSRSRRTDPLNFGNTQIESLCHSCLLLPLFSPAHL